MFLPTKVMDIELSRPVATITGLHGYGFLQALVRLHGDPIGYVTLPLSEGCCAATALSQAILDQHSWPILEHLLNDGLAQPLPPDGLRIADLLQVSHPVYRGALPPVSVAVCTRNRTANLAVCLDALSRLDYPDLELLVVDNAPETDATERLVCTNYPHVRYVQEPRPGLDWARNRAILEAKGEIIAYTDDDVVVDPGWVRALAEVFAEHAEVMAVTGLVVPYELETEPQVLFERYGGFGRGFQRRWYRTARGSKKRVAAPYGGSGQFGTGANMAYRRSLFGQIGLFDPALDVGTVTNGGGDLEMFFRLLKEGHTLVYEPKALVRHRHRREYCQLKKQLANNGIGLYAHFVRSARVYPEERLAFVGLGLWWLKYWNIGRLWRSLFSPARFPRDLILAELRGSFVGLGRYGKAERIAAEIVRTFGPIPAVEAAPTPVPQVPHHKAKNAVAVRIVDLRQPSQALTDVLDYFWVRIFISWDGSLVGRVDITNQYQPIGVARLREAIVAALGLKLSDPNHDLSHAVLWSNASTALAQHYLPGKKNTEGPARFQLSVDVHVSVVVATLDRPEDLRNCLRCLAAQISPRHIEIVVVDNNPESGLTAPVVAEFADIVLVNEPRRGLSYARNAGIVASTGEIVLTTDDDVTLPADWVEKLVAPFCRSDVMVVTGNVLPLELETPAQCLFETYGGLGRGFEPYEVDGNWFASSRRRAVPTWHLGATANAAFRAAIFHHPEIGLMDESLGTGMPSGCSEDTYLFYKVLKAGYTIVYESSAYVWHSHRSNLEALRLQLYNYSKGHVAYHLTTFLRDHDFRALWYLGIDLPRGHLGRVKQRLQGSREYPMSLLLLEIAGNLVGPWALWKSRRRVKREGHSSPYIPVSQRYPVRARSLEA